MKRLSAILFFCCLHPLAAENRPNVVFILADDHGVMDVGIEGGDDFYETPRMDGLARSGMRFLKGYSASQVCSPARASLMLGTYPPRHGITQWIGSNVGVEQAREKFGAIIPPDYVRALPSDQTTIAEAFRDAGYETFFAGKWHLGGKGSWPEDHGFVINRGGWDKGSPIGGFFAPWENPNLESGPDGESLTLRLGRETAAYIKSEKEKPFFAFLSFYAVHAPLQTSEERWRKYRDKVTAKEAPAERFKIDRTLPVRQVRDNPVYAGMLETMDEAIGLVVDAIEAAGLAGNTIIVFTSDHGGVVSGDAYATCMFPLRGGKGRQWEGGLRVPAYIVAPGVTKAGSTTETPMIGTDFFPTLLELAGLPPLPGQHRDGVSLAPVLKGGKIDDRPLFWHYPHYGNQGGEPSSIILKDGWKLIHYWEDGRRELYRLPDDIGEERDLAGEHPDRVREMGAELEAFLAECGAKIPERWAGFNKEEMREKSRQRAIFQMEKNEREQAGMLRADWKPNGDWWGSSLGPD